MRGLTALTLAFFAQALTIVHGANFNWTVTKYVYAFGDSYTFVQGTRGLANFRWVFFLTKTKLGVATNLNWDFVVLLAMPSTLLSLHKTY
jgi:hypothetical protein